MRKSVKIIALILALVMMISSFASCEILEDILNLGNEDDNPTNPDSDNEDPKNPTNDSCKHSWINGTCKLCSAICEHLWINGTCRFCSVTCEHVWKLGICQKCDCPCKHVSEKVHPGSACTVCKREYNHSDYEINVWHDVDVSQNEKYGSGTSPMDIEMSVGELCGRFLSTEFYILRHDILDVYINNRLVTDFSEIVSEYVDLKFAVKETTILVDVQIISDKTDPEGVHRTLFLPPQGVTMSIVGALLFPTTGGFSNLLDIADVTVDGEKITDESFKIVKNCSATVILKSTSGPGDPKDEYITVTFTSADTSEKFEKEFPRGSLLYISDIINQLTGMSFTELLESGSIEANGVEIYEDYRVGEDTDIVYSKIPDGMIKVSFEGIPDMSAAQRLHCSVIVNAGLSFGSIVSELFGISLEEYNEKYFNTRIAEGVHTEWVAVYPDTVFNNSVAITANMYKEHEITDKVYLNVDLNFNGIASQRLELDYGTTIGEALAMLGEDFDALLNDSTVEMFFNTYRILSDAQIKYNSIIYGYKLCMYHEWENRQCTLCGATCYYTYYDEASCPNCGSYHPSENPDDGNRSSILFYQFDENGEMIDDGEKIDIKDGESFREVFNRHFKDSSYDLMNLMDHGFFTVDGTVITEDNMDTIYLYRDIKVEYHHAPYCDHQWTDDGICIMCEKVCSHDWAGNTCVICGFIKQDDPQDPPKNLKYTYVENTPLTQQTRENLTIESGATVYDVLASLGIVDYDKLVYRNEIFVDGNLVTDGNMKLTNDFTITLYRTQKDCSHAFSKDGLCYYCGYDEKNYTPPTCAHESWEKSRCVKCGIWCNSDLNEDTFKHTFENNVCTNCGCTYGGSDHYILVVWAHVDPYYVPYSTTFADYCVLTNLTANYEGYRYFQSILPKYIYPDTEFRYLSPETVLGEYGDETHLHHEWIGDGSAHDHPHIWYNSQCSVCSLVCDHSFNENGKCTVCGCTHGGADHYISVTTFYSTSGTAEAFDRVNVVHYSMTLYELLNMTWEAGYSYAMKFYEFHIGSIQIPGDAVLGSYGDTVTIYAFPIA